MWRPTGKTKVIGLYGHPVEHSCSPEMHNAAFAKLGLDYCYVPFDVPPQRLSVAIDAIRALNMVGVNVTIPHKEAVVPYLNEIRGVAALLRAVNTIVNENGRLVGYNTDGEGFMRSLNAAGVRLKGKRVVIIGAGGAARAVAVTVASQRPASLAILNRTVKKAEEVAALVRRASDMEAAAEPLDEIALKKFIPDAEVIINCTPLGMEPDWVNQTPIPKEFLHKGQVVCDLVYRPRITRFLREAKQAGAKIVDGIGMLVHQGAASFELFTGVKAPVNTMRGAVIAALAAKPKKAAPKPKRARAASRARKSRT